MNKTSFHYAGFWFHVEWDIAGEKGKDQHGTTWINKYNPKCERVWIIPMCKALGETINNAFKKLK